MNAALEAEISFRDICKDFPNGTSALRGLELDIDQGQFVSLVGPSGCGKSTLLRLAAGLIDPSSGGVSIKGSAPSDHAEDLGYVFQEATLMPWTSVFGNVWLPLRVKGISRTKARDQVMDALEMVGLDDRAEHSPGELSGGMKMRVSIARALVTRPRILLMDEPFGALDEITRSRLNDDLLELWSAHGWTVLFVTHSVYESVYLSNRIVVMSANPGRVFADVLMDRPLINGSDFRKSDLYRTGCHVISDTLQSAMTRSG